MKYYADNSYQNKRLSAVFKDGENGVPYYLNAISWRSPNGGCWSGTAYTKDGKKVKSRQFIRTPFTPKTFIIDVDGDMMIKDKAQLEEVFKYYKEMSK